MSASIKIGDVKMPLGDFVVSRSAILGITKSGKTYTAKGIAEQLLEHKVPIIVFDAIGVWRYLKTPGDGSNARGFQVVVAGGKHPDLPLTPLSAPAIVRAAIHENIPLVIDLYDPHLSKADWRRIVQESFRILLYENKGLRHIFLEESAEFAPQKVMDGQTYAEVEKLARMGGNASVGITFINQRAQELNKAVLELCDNLILLRQRGSHAIEALEKWLDRLSPDMAAEIAKSMPHMQQGDCWVFTESAEEPVRTKSNQIRSLHPDRRMPEQALASRKSVDTDEFVQKLSGELTKVIEDHKSNDPVELKKLVARLRKELESSKSTKTEAKPVEVPVLVDTELHHIKLALKKFETIEKSMTEFKPIIERLESEVGKFTVLVGKNHNHWTLPNNFSRQTEPTKKGVADRTAAPIVRRPSATPASSNTEIGGGMKRMMIALAQRSPLTKRQLGVRAVMSSRSGTFGTYMARLRTNGWIDGSEQITITNDGIEALGNYEALPEGAELLNYWLAELGESGAGRMLRCLADAYPKALSKEELGEAANISSSSGTFGTYLARLRTLELAEGRGEIRASKEFFE